MRRGDAIHNGVERMPAECKNSFGACCVQWRFDSSQRKARLGILVAEQNTFGRMYASTKLFLLISHRLCDLCNLGTVFDICSVFVVRHIRYAFPRLPEWCNVLNLVSSFGDVVLCVLLC